MVNLMELPKFIVNINTNYIFELCTPEVKRSKRNYRIYMRIKHDRTIDIKKELLIQLYRKNNAKGFFINCNFYEEALFYQAKLRYEKSTELKTQNEFKEIMETLLEEFPQYLI